MRVYDVFSPSDGTPIYRAPFLWMAPLLCKLFHNHPSNPGRLDYAPEGEGWTR